MHHAGHDLDARLLERADLRREIVGERSGSGRDRSACSRRLSSTGGKPTTLSPQALPSPSFGNRPPTDLVGRHLGPHVGEDGDDVFEAPEEVIGVVEALRPGSPGRLRPMNHGCHGATVEMQGTSFDLALRRTPGWWSRASRPPASGRPCPCAIRSFATSAARFGLDWLSLTTTSTGNVASPILRPPLALLEIRDDELVGLGEGGERAGERRDIAELDRAHLRDRGRF